MTEEARFDWDDGNRVKCQKHGVDPVEIENLLGGARRRIAPDVKHSLREQRFVAVGRNASGRAIFVVFTLRGELIRPLSARYMHAREVRRYEEDS